MRKKLILLPLIAMAIGVVSCGKVSMIDTNKQSYNVYYLDKDEEKIVEVAYEIEKAEPIVLVKELAGLLQTKPEGLGLKACMGEEPLISNVIMVEERIIVNLTKEYEELSSTTEILTRAAIVRTLAQVPQVENISMQIEEIPLTDKAGVPIGTMTADTFIDNTGSEVNNYEKINVTLYFANEEGDELKPVISNQVYNSNDSMEKLVVQQLIKGEVGEEFKPTINPKTKLVSITSKGGICYVNFDKAFLEPMENISAEVAIYSLVNSLIETNNINKVQILIDGRTDIMFMESIPLSSVFERNLGIIEK